MVNLVIVLLLSFISCLAHAKTMTADGLMKQLRQDLFVENFAVVQFRFQPTVVFNTAGPACQLSIAKDVSWSIYTDSDSLVKMHRAFGFLKIASSSLLKKKCQQFKEDVFALQAPVDLVLPLTLSDFADYRIKIEEYDTIKSLVGTVFHEAADNVPGSKSEFEIHWLSSTKLYYITERVFGCPPEYSHSSARCDKFLFSRSATLR